ncbi:MAG: hypothetical protein CSA82_01570 [Actinobacteria bacterium]|nr:MAG: hypothetical protein CSA82_01570 [Actinomycetota bacterium]
MKESAFDPKVFWTLLGLAVLPSVALIVFVVSGVREARSISVASTMAVLAVLLWGGACAYRCLRGRVRERVIAILLMVSAVAFLGSLVYVVMHVGEIHEQTKPIAPGQGYPVALHILGPLGLGSFSGAVGYRVWRGRPAQSTAPLDADSTSVEGHDEVQ